MITDLVHQAARGMGVSVPRFLQIAREEMFAAGAKSFNDWLVTYCRVVGFSRPLYWDIANNPWMLDRAQLGYSLTKITDFNANGKNYTDANGVVQFAPAGTPYCHHVWRNSRYEPVGVLWETGRTDALGGKGWDVGNSSDWTRTGLDAGVLPTVSAAGLTFTLGKESATTGAHGFSRSFTLAATSCAWAVTVLSNGVTREWVRIEIDSGAGGRTSQWVNTTTGAIGTSLGTISGVRVDQLASGVLIIRGVFAGLTAASRIFRLRSATADGELDYAGDTSKGLYFGPCMVVDGATEVGSLIPASGSRTQDSAQIPNPLGPIASRFDLDIDYTPNAATSGTERVLASTLDGSNNGFELYIDTANKLSLRWNSASATLQSAALTFAAGTTYPLRMSVSNKTVTLYQDRNAANVASAEQAAALTTMDSVMYLGRDRSTAKHANGAVRLVRDA